MQLSVLALAAALLPSALGKVNPINHPVLNARYGPDMRPQPGQPSLMAGAGPRFRNDQTEREQHLGLMP